MKRHFILISFLLASCTTQGVKLPDGTWVVNHHEFFHKADSQSDTTDMTAPGGYHIVMTHSATKPDGTEATKFASYAALVSLGKSADNVTENAAKQTTLQQSNAQASTLALQKDSEAATAAGKAADNLNNAQTIARASKIPALAH